MIFGHLTKSFKTRHDMLRYVKKWGKRLVLVLDLDHFSFFASSTDTCFQLPTFHLAYSAIIYSEGYIWTNISIWCTELHPVVLIICSKQDVALGPLPFDMIDIDPWDLKNEWWRVVGTPYHPKKPHHRARETENGRGGCTHFQCIFVY